MSIDDTDVLARLRAGADTVEERQFDAHEVLAGSRRALRRRRSWQAVGACTTAALVTFSLVLAGPVPVPGLGDVTLPGSEQMRELLGLADADASDCVAPEPAVRRGPVESGTSLRPGVTFDLARARPMSTCFDVRIDGTVQGSGLSPETLTEEGMLWREPEDAADADTDRAFTRVDPFNDGIGQILAPALLTPADDEVHTVGGLTPQGDEAAWFELIAPRSDQPPDRTVLAAGGRRVDPVSGEYRKSRAIAEIDGDYGGDVAVTATRVAWRQAGGAVTDTGTASPWTMPAWAAPVVSGEPELLTEHATAIGGDDDEFVVATLDQSASSAWTTTFISFADDGTETTVLTLEHPLGTYVPLVDITDDLLTYALDGGYHLAVVPREDGVADPDAVRAVAVRLSNASASSLSAAGDAVTWVSSEVAYMLRDAGVGGESSPDLVRIDQGGLSEHIVIHLVGDRIAWSTTTTNYRTGTAQGSNDRLTVGTLPGTEQPSSADAAGAESDDRAVPAAPTVTVPENAILRTYD